jgi:hypothetical protein
VRQAEGEFARWFAHCQLHMLARPCQYDFAAEREASAARGLIRVRWTPLFDMPCSQSHCPVAYFLDRQVLLQILAPFGVIEGLSLNQSDETLSLNLTKILC